MTHSKRLGFLLLAALLMAPSFAPGAVGPASARADDGKGTGSEKGKKGEDKEEAKKPSVDADQVYYGRARQFLKPAEVDADAVYAKIDEFKAIGDEGLEPGEVRYELLMAKASKRFGKALRKTAKAAGYDLVAALGAVKDADSVPDITDGVIENL